MVFLVYFPQGVLTKQVMELPRSTYTIALHRSLLHWC